MKKLNILIVDDDRDFAESLAEVLELRGHDVDLVFDGEEAINKFLGKVYDITFMDVKLPGKNGVESYIEIRNIRPEAKVVMMTGYSVEQLLDQAVENGAWAILHKPLNMVTIFDMVDKIKPDGILIVDDDVDFVESIKSVLKTQGYNVYKAHNGQEAIQRVRENNIQFMILDLRLPILNGLEVYLELKKTGHKIPTIIATAFATEEKQMINDLQSLTITGILNKPFNPQTLLDLLSDLIK
ncbi:MAG: response regulator [bacterium]